MRKKLTTTLALLITLVCLGQEKDVREQAYLHINSSVLLTGETLYFSAYVNSAQSGKPSQLSKILYVELVGENGAVFQQKIKLDDGRGSGDYFVPSVVSTGTYQLIAYTRWMKNFENYFRAPISIINPYEEYTAPQEAKNGKVSMQLLPAQGRLVRDIDNTVSYKINRGGIDSLSFKAKLVDESGEVMVDFEPGKSESGQFIFRPKSGAQYQIIMEDQLGQFHFITLSEMQSAGTNIFITEQKHFYEVKLQTSPSSDLLASLQVSKGSQLLFERSVGLDSRINIPKEQLADGLLKFRVLNDQGSELASSYLASNLTKFDTEPTEKTFGNREFINLPLDLDEGEYSISIRKKLESISAQPVHTEQIDFVSAYGIEKPLIRAFLGRQDDATLQQLLVNEKPNREESNFDSVSYLPEFRDEIVAGYVTNSKNEPMTDVAVSMSFPGKNFQVQMAKADANGYFFHTFSSVEEDKDAYFTLVNYKDKYYNIEPISNFLQEYPSYDYKLIALDTTQIKEVIQRSVRNQIENAYYTYKKDSIQPGGEWLPQLDFNYHYVLDEWTRFETLQEHFVEYIFNASLRKKKDPVFNFLMKYPNRSFNTTPLVLFDGIPVTDTTLIDYDPYKLENIGIINNRFFIGEMVFDGVVSMGTYHGDLLDYKLNDQIVKHKVIGLSPQKTYYKPDYDSQANERIPDQREQLLWMPQYDGASNEVSFYTSDVDGTFEMVVEGYTKDGKPVTKLMSFKVE